VVEDPKNWRNDGVLMNINTPKKMVYLEWVHHLL